MIRQYLSKIIDDHKNEWKIQLTMETTFFSSKDSNETHTMYTTTNFIEIMIGYETSEITEGLLNLFSKDTKKD